MILAGLVLAGVAAVVHVYIFVLESLAWNSPRARATFGTTRQTAEASRELAFNQGFYNLFLALVTAAGIVVLSLGERTVGATMLFVGLGSMVAAGLVLLLRSRARARAALVQATPPLLSVITLVVGLTAA